MRYQNGTLAVRCLGALLAIAGLTTFASAADQFCLVEKMMIAFAEADSTQWSQFRGPNGSGVVNAFRPPVKIDPERPAWKTPLPPGKSSPVLWDGRILL